MSSFFDELRATEFPQLQPGMVYADWVGAALPPVRLINAHHKVLTTTVLGNPHSHHEPSTRALQQIMDTRMAILRYFHASPSEYEVIFTQNATAAIRMLEHYKWIGGELLMTADNHNSINGLRETAKRGDAIHRYAPILPNMQLDEEKLERMLKHPRSSGNRIFIYPAKSNYTGTLHSLEWVKRAKDLGWDVMLDAAAYLSNRRLDLSVVKPDFVPVSFYKLFGYPTGVGCLIIKKDVYPHMHKKWFAGGSILLVSVMKDFFAHESLGYARFEDGTVNFAMIPAVINGLEFMESMNNLDTHAAEVATALYDALVEMGGGPNAPVIHSGRGNDTVTFSVKKGGQIVDAWHFEQFANTHGIYVRTGCFCNPGSNEMVFGYSVDDFEAVYNDAVTTDEITIEKLREFSEAPIGSIRASFGYANTLNDADRIAEVVSQFVNSKDTVLA